MLGHRASGRRPSGLRTAGLALAVIAACGCSGTLSSNAPAIPLCTDMPSIVASADAYAGGGVETNQFGPIRRWTGRQPAFEAMWVDHEAHPGWHTLAFSRDAAARQADFRREFPDLAMVAVEVPWTKDELEAIQQRVSDAGRSQIVGVGAQPDKGVVAIYVRVLDPATVAAIESNFGGLRVCLERMDPPIAAATWPSRAHRSARLEQDR